MDDEVYCCVGCIITIFVIFTGFSIFGTISDLTNHDAENIYLSSVTTQITNFSSENTNGEISTDYFYFVSFSLKNVTSRFSDSTIVVSLYENNNLIIANDGSQNISLNIGDDTELEYNYVPVSVSFSFDKLVNVTHFAVIVIDDEEVIFNETHPFNMNNYENYNPVNFMNDSKDETSSSSNPNGVDSNITFVASVNSDKFHEPSCSQAKRIKDENKITFSSREEALDAGYHSCSICNP